MIICGVDEAGRGAMMGPLVVAGIGIQKQKIEKLGELGVRDSKKLLPYVREHLANEIIKLVDRYTIMTVPPRTVDLYVYSKKLNELEAHSMAKIIKSIEPDISYIDSCDVNFARFGSLVSNIAKTGKVVSRHHADDKYLVVGAASILAKVRRDKHIARINAKYPIGSGYPSDPRAVAFLQGYRFRSRLPSFVRCSWKPVSIMLGSRRKQ